MENAQRGNFWELIRVLEHSTATDGTIGHPEEGKSVMRRFLLKFLEWSAVLVAAEMLFNHPSQVLSKLNGCARGALRTVDEWIASRDQARTQGLEDEIGQLEQDVRRQRDEYEVTGSPASFREWKDLETLVLSLRIERAGLIGNHVRRERADQASTDRIREMLGYSRRRRTAAETATIADVAAWLDKLDGEARRRLIAELRQREDGIREGREPAAGYP